MRLLSGYEQEQCAADKQALTSQNWKCKMQHFESLLFFKQDVPPLSSPWKACVCSLCIGTDSVPPYAPSTYSILSCFAQTHQWKQCCCLNGGMPNNSFPFSFSIPFVLGQSDPCLAPGVHFLDPAFLQPSPSYLHPCRPQ